MDTDRSLGGKDVENLANTCEIYFFGWWMVGYEL